MSGLEISRPELCEKLMIKMIVKDVGEPLDGLVVYIDAKYSENLKMSSGLVPIIRIENKHALFKSFSLPISSSSLWIDVTNLSEYRDISSVELDTSNPFGNFEYSQTTILGPFALVHNVYEHGATVSVRQGDDLLFNRSFFSTHALEVGELIDSILHDDTIKYDPDCLLFDLSLCGTD